MNVRSPVTEGHIPAFGDVWGRLWYVGVRFNVPYVISGTVNETRHTGVDLQLPKNLDWHQPVYSAFDGVVHIETVGQGKTWGRVMVIRCQDDAGRLLVQRFAHYETPHVKAGDMVVAGQQVCNVGDGSGYYRGTGAHLHYDIGITDIMLKNGATGASYWPGNNAALINQHFADPIMLLPLLANPNVNVIQVRVNTSPGHNLNVRAEPSSNAAIVSSYPSGTLIKVSTPPVNGFYQLAERYAFVSADWVGAPQPAPDLVARYVYTPGSCLNVRLGPGTSYGIDDCLPDGERVMVSKTPTNGFVRQADNTWLSAAYLRDAPAPVEDDNDAVRVGLHSFSTVHDNATLAALQGVARTGRYVAGLTLVKQGYESDFSVAAVKAVSPRTKVMYRVYRSNEPGYDWNKVTRADGVNYARSYYSLFDSADLRAADYDQIINEPGYGDPARVAAFWQGALDVAAEKERKLGIFCYAERNPPLPVINANQPWSNFWMHPDIVTVLRRAMREKHVLLLHQYVISEPDQAQAKCWDWVKSTWQQDKLYRHQLIYKLLPADLQSLPLWIGELGDIRMPQCGPGHLADSIAKFKAATLHDSYLMAACIWTWGGAGTEWATDDLWPMTEDYINAVIR